MRGWVEASKAKGLFPDAPGRRPVPRPAPTVTVAVVPDLIPKSGSTHPPHSVEPVPSAVPKQITPPSPTDLAEHRATGPASRIQRKYRAIVLVLVVGVAGYCAVFRPTFVKEFGGTWTWIILVCWGATCVVVPAAAHPDSIDAVSGSIVFEPMLRTFVWFFTAVFVSMFFIIGWPRWFESGVGQFLGLLAAFLTAFIPYKTMVECFDSIPSPVLLPCPACGGKVSERANVCPHCGHPMA